jgi:hypothetical protein
MHPRQFEKLWTDQSHHQKQGEHQRHVLRQGSNYHWYQSNDNAILEHCVGLEPLLLLLFRIETRCLVEDLEQAKPVEVFGRI